MALADDQTVIVAAIDLQIEKKKQKPVKDVTGWRQAVDKPGDRLETGRDWQRLAGTAREKNFQGKAKILTRTVFYKN